MKALVPKNAMQALRLARCAENARRGEFDVFPQGDGKVSLYSWKADEQGKRTKTLYIVDVEEWACTCPDFTAHRDFCKHLIYTDDLARQEEEEAFAASMADGQEFMENLHTERSIVY